MTKSTKIEKIILTVLIVGIIAYLVYTNVQRNKGFITDSVPVLTVEKATINVGKTTVDELTNNGYNIGYTDDNYPGLYIVSGLDEEVEPNTHITNALIANEEQVLADAYLSNYKMKKVNVKDAVVSYVTVNLEGDYITANYKDTLLNDIVYDENDEFFNGFESYDDNKVMKKIKAEGSRYAVVMSFDEETKKIDSITVALYEQFEKTI